MNEEYDAVAYTHIGKCVLLFQSICWLQCLPGPRAPDLPQGHSAGDRGPRGLNEIPLPFDQPRRLQNDHVEVYTDGQSDADERACRRHRKRDQRYWI